MKQIENNNRRINPVAAHVLGLILVSFGAIFSAGCVISPASEIRDASFPAAGVVSLTVNSFNGLVEIDRSTDNVVAIQSVLKDAPRIDYSVVQNGNAISVTAAPLNEWLPFFSWHGADIHVSVPAGAVLDIETSNGRILVDGSENGGTLQTSNGGITIQNAKGKFTASTSNGKIQVSAYNGSGSFKTSNGGVTLENVAGDFIVSTSNGGITFNGELIKGGQNRLTSSNGGVIVTLLGTKSAVLDASTSNGRVDCQIPILSRSASGTHLNGTIGAGDADLFIKTSNGDVVVK